MLNPYKQKPIWAWFWMGATAIVPPVIYANFTEVVNLTPLVEIQQLTAEEIDFNTAQTVRGGTPIVMDWDGDGWLDLYIVQFGFEDLLFRNVNGSFTKVPNPLNLPADNGGNVPIWADFDNDGDKDLFLATAERNTYLFYVNEGNGVYTEAAAARGVDLPSTAPHRAGGVAAGDINLDGYLDIVVGDWGIGVEDATRYEHYAVFLNEGTSNPGHFTNITKSSGVLFPDPEIDFYSPMVSDLDGDGWPDLPIVADFFHSRLFFNNANLTFSDTTAISRVSIEENGMGSAIGDVNGDGRLDYFVTSIHFPEVEGYRGNQLYINQGGRLFDSITEPGDSAANVAVGGWGWGTDLFDYDNDGDLDVVMTGGADVPELVFGSGDENMGPMRMWENRGDGTFVEISDDVGVNRKANGAGLVTFDYDNDGDLDIFVINQFSTPQLLRNDTANSNNWLRLRLEGILSNRDAFGAQVKVEITEGGTTLISEYNPTNTYLAQKEPVVHFGLGAGVETVHRVTVSWPGGGKKELTNVATNQVLDVLQDDFSFTPQDPTIEKEPLRQILNPGDDLILTIQAGGSPDPLVLWYHNGELIPGVEGETLTIPNVTREDAGKYFATLANVRGVAFTTHARVSIRPRFDDKSVARQWMEELLDAIRLDYPAPTVHSRNLFSLSTAMWDAWVAYDASGVAVPRLAEENPTIPFGAVEVKTARNQAISFAAYRVLSSRFRLSPNADISLPSFRDRMIDLGNDPDDLSMEGNSPTAIGNRIAARVLAWGWTDGANEVNAYADQTGYVPINDPLIFKMPGVEVNDPNAWQPLAFDFLILQNGIPVGEAVQEFLGPNWGWVTPFALTRDSSTDIYSDPGHPPYLGDPLTDQAFKDAAIQVAEFQSWHDPNDGVMVDVSPRSNATPFPRHRTDITAVEDEAFTLGQAYGPEVDGVLPEVARVGYYSGRGYDLNPVTGEPYEPNMVLRADYGRILAEFWADGPDSETPPGHWNSVANTVSDDPRFEKRFEGEGPVLDELEWDVKLYFALNAAVSDAAIACWDAKRKYNYVRPITMIRYMGGKGQSSNPDGPSYHQEGLPLRDGFIEVITEASTAEGERHAHLSQHVGEIAIFTWRGIPDNPNTEIGGVGWIRAVEWMPYQRDTFVTPPFGAYTSGHSTFSRSAAEILAAITGSPYFPGGISSFTAEANEFLEFEKGPTQDVTLTWATYYDAADEAGISRLYGGIHVWADDIRGRIMGSDIGKAAYAKARTYFVGTAQPENWAESFNRWAEELSSYPEEYSDPNTYYQDGFTELARYFFGVKPFGTSAGDTPLTLALNESTHRSEVQFVVPNSIIEREYVLEFSEDLVTWTSLGPEGLNIQTESIGEARMRVTIQDPMAFPVTGQRFYRVRLADQ